jgi:hypothetical protein
MTMTSHNTLIPEQIQSLLVGNMVTISLLVMEDSHLPQLQEVGLKSVQ